MTDRAQEIQERAEAHASGYSCEQAEREIGLQMVAKLEAQQSLRLICEAIDLPLNQLADGWSASLPTILARIETIVDEADRAFRERDALLSERAAALKVIEAARDVYSTIVDSEALGRVLPNRTAAIQLGASLAAFDAAQAGESTG